MTNPALSSTSNNRHRRNGPIAAIQRALAIPANQRTGTLHDVEHIVILTQENRSFDHYFGGLNGVRGFADPFPIPVPDSGDIAGKTVWSQPNASATAASSACGRFSMERSCLP